MTADLESLIANWRREMLAAGIKTPVPLEELESHLREDIDWPDHSQTACVHQPDLDPLLGQCHPRINIGRIVVEVDQDVIPLAKF